MERPSTKDPEYAERLQRLQGARWKRLLNVQAPYAWNLRRLHPGFMLDVGCGIGRNLEHVGGEGVGIDHNAECVEIARRRGFRAFTPEEFAASEYAAPARFDSMLLSDVLEHMERGQALELVARYLPHVRPGGHVILIAPQEVGQRSDATHVTFMDFAALGSLGRELGLAPSRAFSFPFPRPVGKLFVYNQFVWVGRLPNARSAERVTAESV